MNLEEDFIILLRTKLTDQDKVADFLTRVKHVKQIHRVLGDYDVATYVCCNGDEATLTYTTIRKECLEFFPSKFQEETCIARLSKAGHIHTFVKQIRSYVFIKYGYQPSRIKLVDLTQKLRDMEIDARALERLPPYSFPPYDAVVICEFDSFEGLRNLIFKQLAPTGLVLRTSTMLVIG